MIEKKSNIHQNEKVGRIYCYVEYIICLKRRNIEIKRAYTFLNKVQI